MIDIEAIVNKYYEEWQTVPDATIRDQILAALTDLASGYEQRIRQLEGGLDEAKSS